jgi:hypothetical protein
MEKEACMRIKGSMICAAILAAVFSFVPTRPAFAQGNCTAKVEGPLEKVALPASPDAKSFVLHLSSADCLRRLSLGNLPPVTELLTVTPDYYARPRHSTYDFDGSWLAMTVIPIRNYGFYVVTYLAPDREHASELASYAGLMNTFEAVETGYHTESSTTTPPSPPGTTECEYDSPEQVFKIACPRGWTMSKDSEGDYFLQVNWSPVGDPTRALNVAWRVGGTPNRLKDGSFALYKDGDDFIKQTLDSYGISGDFALNPADSSANGRETLTKLTLALQQAPNDESLRKKILELASSLDPRPVYPDQAQQHFSAGATLIEKRQPELAEAAAKEFRKALEIAPWWPEAYYDLSMAVALTGDYDDAIQQLQFYLLLKPSAADAADAQGRIIALRAEKESAAKLKEQHQTELSLQHVSGGTQRFRVADAPAAWYPADGSGEAEMYGYTLPEEQPYFANIFRMPNGRILAVSLEPQFDHCDGGSQPVCLFTGDGIVIVDLTHDPCFSGNFNRPFHYGDIAQQTDEICGYQYTVSVSNQPDAIVSITSGQAGIALPVSLLYRGRAFAAYTVDQQHRNLVQVAWSSSDGKAMPVQLGFDDNIKQESQSPTVNPLSLIPSYVAVLRH